MTVYLYQVSLATAVYKCAFEECGDPGDSSEYFTGETSIAIGAVLLNLSRKTIY